MGLKKPTGKDRKNNVSRQKRIRETDAGQNNILILKNILWFSYDNYHDLDLHCGWGEVWILVFALKKNSWSLKSAAFFDILAARKFNYLGFARYKVCENDTWQILVLDN